MNTIPPSAQAVAIAVDALQFIGVAAIGLGIPYLVFRWYESAMSPPPIELAVEEGPYAIEGNATAAIVAKQRIQRRNDLRNETGCAHPETELIAGNCTYEDAYLRTGEIVLTTYRPYYPQCTECDEIIYETRYDARGNEDPVGEQVWTTTIPLHEYSDYLDAHRRDVSEMLQSMNQESDDTETTH